MKKRCVKLISLMLTLLMLVSVIPVGFADEGEVPQETKQTETAAPAEEAKEPAKSEAPKDTAKEPAESGASEEPAKESVKDSATEEPAEEPTKNEKPQEATEKPVAEPAEEPAKSDSPEEATEEPAKDEVSEEAKAEYPWDGLDDDAFVKWVLSGKNDAALRKILEEKGAAAKALTKRVAAVRDEKEREAVEAWLEGLLKDDAEKKEPAESNEPVESEEPVENENPVKSGEPVESEEPAKAEEPVEGEAPVEGETPIESGEPVQGELPVEGEEPGESEAPIEGEPPVEGEEPGESEAPIEGELPVEGEEPAEGEEPVESEESVEGEEPSDGESWESLDDDAFAAWVLSGENDEKINALSVDEGAYAAFLARVEAIENEELRLSVQAHIALLAGAAKEEAPAPATMVTFLSEQAITLTVQGPEGEVLPEDTAWEDKEDAAAFHAVYLLTPGSYTYSASAYLCVSLENVSFEIEEGADELTISVALESLLPNGFRGMPEGYELSKEELAGKQALIDHNIVDQLSGLKSGKDYKDGEVFFLTESKKYAQMVADAYNADLVKCAYGVAVLRLRTATVLEAVTAAADMSYPLPAVEPSYYTKIDPIIRSGSKSGNGFNVGESAPIKQTWKDWNDRVKSLGLQPDPYLRDPVNRNYQYMHDAVNTYAAWGVADGSGVYVGIIDSGVDGSHEDLNIYKQIDIGCGTGDSGTHGTHVAGIIAAKMGNGLGGAGIAPGAKIISVRASSDGRNLETDDIIMAINAIKQDAHAKIINMSLGGYFYSYNYESAIRSAIKSGITFVVAMGNDGTNIKKYPAAFNIPGLIAVTASNEAGKRAGYSTYGSWSDIMAPGTHIMSTVPGNVYEKYDGTSMAAPVVTGVCALYMDAYGNPGPAKMESIIKGAKTKSVIDASKLFSADKASPVITASELLSGKAAYDATIDIRKATGSANDGIIIYTVNGKDPKAKSGVVTVGQAFTGSIKANVANGFVPGKKNTVKAICISGMGVKSKMATLTFTLQYKAASSVSILTATNYVLPGKSITMEARVNPVGEAKQKVTWSIVNRNGCPGATIDAKTGLVKTKAADNGYIEIKATSADGSRSATYMLNVQPQTATAKVRLSNKTLTLWAGEASATISKTVLDANGGELSYVNVKWTSSNPAVAAVDNNGTVQPGVKGKAVITCQALDGSGMKATCTVNVKQAPTGIAVTGPAEVVPGKTYTFKAKLSPSKPDKRIVNWYCGTSDGDAVPISSSGKLTVPSTLSEGAFIYVIAMTEDGAGNSLSDGMAVTVKNEIQKITLEGDAINGSKYNTYGILKSLTLYSVETDYWDSDDEKTWVDTAVQLNAWITDAYGQATSDNSRVTWSSSNPGVATVDSNGYVQAIKAGKATIKAKAQDGSKKSASVEVNVINPASGLVIKSSSGRLDEDEKYLTLGKTVTNKAVFYNKSLGKATVTKVNWYWEISAFNSDGESVDWLSDLIRDKKWITFSKGKLTAKNTSTFASYVSDYNIYVYVQAYSKDASGSSASMYYRVVNPIKKIIIGSIEYGKSTWDDSDYRYIWFSKPKTKYTLTLPKHTKEDPYIIYLDLYVNYAGGAGSFKVKSSNPEVAGAASPYAILTTGKSGTAKITITSESDNKTKFVLTVKVK